MARPHTLMRLTLRQPVGLTGAILAGLGAVFAVVGLFVPAVSGPFRAIGGGLVAAGAVALVLAARRGRRLQGLALHGVAVEGEALGFRRTHVRINTATQYRLRFAFVGRDGVRREGLGELAPPEDVVTIPVGTRVTVLVDPEDPGSFALERDVRAGFEHST